MAEKKPSELVERIENDLKVAMKAREMDRVGALRLIRAALQNRRIEKREELDESEVIACLSTQAKQRRDSIEQFKAGGRDELADKEIAELAVIQAYLPEQMGEAQVREAVQAAIAESGAAGPKDMGKVMGVLMSRIKGKADGKLVNTLVRSLLAGDES